MARDSPAPPPLYYGMATDAAALAAEEGAATAPGASALDTRRIVARRRQLEPLYYSSYLKVPELLSLQRPKSEEAGAAAHDEMLFIITHQAYELWFKQILHELNSVRALFGSTDGSRVVAERDMGLAVSRLERVREIQTLMLQQINVMETMSALDFLVRRSAPSGSAPGWPPPPPSLTPHTPPRPHAPYAQSFRDFLYPASGFQSVQFRLIENCLGLRPAQRLSYGGRTGYCSVLNEADAGAVAASEGPESLFQLMEAWLERTPFLECEADGDTAGFSFWEHYRTAVQAMLDADEVFMRANSAFTPATLESHAKDLSSQREHFESLLDAQKYAASLERGERRLSHRATQAALMITLFQREPGLHLPHRFITGLMGIDEQLCAWRARHAQMVHRMLGAKLGTGGSSGYSYLKATVDKHRIFTDLFNLSTFLIPAAMLPPLPLGVSQRLGFNFSASGRGTPGGGLGSSGSSAVNLGAVAAGLEGGGGGGLHRPQASSRGGVGAAGGGSGSGGAAPGVCPFGHS